MKHKYGGGITDSRMETFLMMHSPEVPEYLDGIASYARERHVPVIRRLTGGALIFFLNAFGAKRVLEIGTAIGYSALYMAEGKKDIRIDTIERVPEKIESARENFEKYDGGKRIRLIAGDALDILPGLIKDGMEYDFVFIDASKGQYKIFADYAYVLLKQGGAMVTDNIMQEGEILDSRYAVARRNRTIHARMREYLREITHSDRWNTLLLPISDGIAVSVKK